MLSVFRQKRGEICGIHVCIDPICSLRDVLCTQLAVLGGLHRGFRILPVQKKIIHRRPMGNGPIRPGHLPDPSLHPDASGCADDAGGPGQTPQCLEIFLLC